jgi:hypothetical protein
MNNSLPTDSIAASIPLLPGHTQDEAYTLAYYLLGNEARADEAVAAVFSRRLPTGRGRAEDNRLEILRAIGLYCQAHGATPAWGIQPGGDEIISRLGRLNGSERAAAVLVDVLGLSYAQAARVLSCSQHRLGKLLAHARLNLARGMIN